jgi:hypothetical protein
MRARLTAKASDSFSLPEGRGLPFVLCMNASMSLSKYSLNALAPAIKLAAAAVEAATVSGSSAAPSILAEDRTDARKRATVPKGHSRLD